MTMRDTLSIRPAALPAAPAPAPAAKPGVAKPAAPKLARDAYEGSGGRAVEDQPGLTRLPYTGGTPALKMEQMDQAMVKNNLILRGLYALPERFRFMLQGYQGLTKVLGPLGAAAFFGVNVKNSIAYLKDPKTPAFAKVSVTGATALSGVTAAIALRMGASVFGLGPMSTTALKSWGRVAGLAGGGAGVLLAGLDTFNTLRNPNATAAEKGFSIMGTGAAVGLLGFMAAGMTGPLGIVLGVSSLALPFLKGFLAKNKVANQVFGTIGNGLKSAWNGVKKLFGG